MNKTMQDVRAGDQWVEAKFGPPMWNTEKVTALSDPEPGSHETVFILLETESGERRRKEHFRVTPVRITNAPDSPEVKRAKALQAAAKALQPFADVADKYDFWTKLPEYIEFPPYDMGPEKQYQNKVVLTQETFEAARDALVALRREFPERKTE